jgi:hypothetical protein
LVTTSRLEVLVPSTCEFRARCVEHRYNEGKEICNRSTMRAVMSLKGAKKRFLTTNETKL